MKINHKGTTMVKEGKDKNGLQMASLKYFKLNFLRFSVPLNECKKDKIMCAIHSCALL